MLILCTPYSLFEPCQLSCKSLFSVFIIYAVIHLYLFYFKIFKRLPVSSSLVFLVCLTLEFLVIQLPALQPATQKQ